MAKDGLCKNRSPEDPPESYRKSGLHDARIIGVKAVSFPQARPSCLHGEQPLRHPALAGREEARRWQNSIATTACTLFHL